MSSGFVSAGTNELPIERDEEWHKAQAEIEANRRRKEEEFAHQEGKTLYEVLQNNKAAKQEAFEEAAKLKNQFRHLDEDEVDFLDSVLESTRQKEAEVKKDTGEQLEAFKRQQEEADRAARADDDEGLGQGSPTNDIPTWAVGRKRKRKEKEEGVKGVKIRRGSSGLGETQASTQHRVLEAGAVGGKKGAKGVNASAVSSSTKGDTQKESGIEQQKADLPPKIVPVQTTNGVSNTPKPALNLALAGYSSEEN